MALPKIFLADAFSRLFDSRLRRIVVKPAPAVGVDFLATIPADEYWIVHSLRFSLVTDATAVTRNAHVFTDDGTSEYFRVGEPSGQGATSTMQYSFFEGLGAVASVTNCRLGALPTDGLRIPQAGRLRSGIVNLQAGDQLGAFTLDVTVLSLSLLAQMADDFEADISSIVELGPSLE